MLRRDLHEENRRSWNEATRAHNSHKRDQASFLRDGGSTLFPEEVRLLGDVAGKRLLHLCCNSGQDTLSLVRAGAFATGLDISDEAIGTAARLSGDSGLPATFVRGDVYDLLPTMGAGGARFDIVFASYGALCWLSDLPALMRGVTSVLLPGGRFVVVEFHPTGMMFDESLQHRYAYSSHGEPYTHATGVRDYVQAAGGALSPSGHLDGEPAFENPHPAHEFVHGLADVVQATIDAGLAVERLEEWSFTNGCPFFDGMRLGEGRRYTLPEGVPAMPLMYGFVARA
jgi:SAM-dependent methyltransferase